jgi:hypothetical protein
MLDRTEAAIEKMSNEQVKIMIQVDEAALAGAVAKVKEAFASVVLNVTATAGGDAPAMAAGGPINGPSNPVDSLLAWVTGGEYVMRNAAVRHYGQGFMDMVNGMALPRFAVGGAVGPSAGRGASGAEGETTLHLTYQGRSLGRVQGSRDTVKSITRALKDLSRGVS